VDSGTAGVQAVGWDRLGRRQICWADTSHCLLSLGPGNLFRTEAGECPASEETNCGTCPTGYVPAGERRKSPLRHELNPMLTGKSSRE